MTERHGRHSFLTSMNCGGSMARKMPWKVALAAVLLLAGCGGDVRSTPVTPKLLENTSAIQRIGNRLDPEERQLFGSYVMGRALSTSTGWRSVQNAKGNDPGTVGEAIDLMRAQNARAEQVQALYAERDARWKEMDKIHEVLRQKAEAADWAPKETDASNAFGDQMNAMQEDYGKRVAALQAKPLSPMPKPKR